MIIPAVARHSAGMAKAGGRFAAAQPDPDATREMTAKVRRYPVRIASAGQKLTARIAQAHGMAQTQPTSNPTLVPNSALTWLGR